MESDSTLHAMALLQVHQAKALKDLHKGGHDLEVLKELRTATTAHCLSRRPAEGECCL